jgi:hypothetical protein
MSREDFLGPLETLTVCREILDLMHAKKLTGKQTYAVVCLLTAFAARTVELPEDATLRTVKDAFGVIDDMLKAGKPALDS